MTKQQIVDHLRSPESADLFAEADRVRKECCGDSVHLRGIVEFSNHCRRNCLYCGLRKDNWNVMRYRMSPDEIVASVKLAVELGYGTVVLQSGEDEDFSFDSFCALIKGIKADFDIAVTACIGELNHDAYRRLRDCGCDRYLLKIETSRSVLFKKLKPDSVFRARLQCLLWLKQLGFEVGSGIMVGLPGQAMETLAEDILLFKELGLDMIGIGPFLAHQGTPLALAQSGTLDLTLRVIALTRIVTRNTNIPATTAIGSLDPQGRQRALACGANVMMPNVTPKAYRKFYEIYPGKICIAEQPSDCGGCVKAMVEGLGRTVGSGPGSASTHG